MKINLIKRTNLTKEQNVTLTPLRTLSVYEKSLACREMIKIGIPKNVVSAHLLAECGIGFMSLDYLEVRYGKMYGPRKKK